jgi:soluble lytic murein transglycosylase-like protein
MRSCLLAAWFCLAAAGLPRAAEVESPKISSVVKTDPSTGRLVRRVVIPPEARARIEANARIQAAESAERYQVDPLLVESVIEVESDYNPFAVSSKGARGLMQLMPQTARRLSVADSFNLSENIDGGVRYLKYLLSLFGDETHAVAAYNAGEGAVLKYGGVPPYPETARYVKRVNSKLKQAKARAAARRAATGRGTHLERFTDSEGRLHYRTIAAQ